MLGFFYGLPSRFGEKEKQDTLILQQLALHNFCAHLNCIIDGQRCPDCLQISIFDVSASNLMTLVALLARWGRWVQRAAQPRPWQPRKGERQLKNPPYEIAKRKESTVNDLMIQQEDFAGRCQKVLQVAKPLFQEKPDWVTFFRETLGVKGAARAVFQTQEEYVLFEQSKEFSEIQNMVASLRTRKAGGSKNEPTRVITVRLPESLHEALKAEANDHNTSMNKLCISKLLQVLVENEKAAQAAAASTRQSIIPNNSVPKPTQPALSPQSPSPAQSPSFRSTYNPPTNNSQPHRFGQ